MTQAILTASSWIQEAIFGFADLMKSWKINRARKAMARRTYNELQKLTDRELHDLGIGRTDIPSIARGTFDDVRIKKTKTTTNENLKGWV